MARTIQEIQTAILAEKAKHSVLNSLNSPSATAIWQLWVYVTAVCVYEFEKLLDLYKAEIEQKNRNAIVGRASWYAAKALEFQYGDSLVVVDGVVRYATLDPSKQIVKRAACKGGANSILKVATLNGSGGVMPLDNSQLAAFTDYVSNFMFAGTNLVILSQATDLLRLTLEVYYDPLLAVDTVKANCIVAIENYLANLDFNGILKVSALEDAIQAVAGVKDVFIQTIEAKENAGVYAPVVRAYQTVAGYIQIDTATYPLATNLTMIADES